MRFAILAFISCYIAATATTCVGAFVPSWPVLSKANTHLCISTATIQSQDCLLDFEASSLLPNTISPISWSATGEAVSPHSHRLGLDPKVTDALLEYCHDTGITKTFESLLIDGNPLAPGSEITRQLGGDNSGGGYNWHMQRPEAQWNSNAHWISPSDKQTHDEYLKVLSKGGFDKALESIGTHFGFDGLSVYHLSFIGVSRCTKGYVHYDFEEIDGKGFNLIIPLILAEDAEPELDIEQRGDMERVGRYKYVRNEANMVGDLVGHATSACDYIDQGAMRMAATVYVADINTDNSARLASYITQRHPPRFDSQYLMDQAGAHWKPGDPTKRLPSSACLE